MNTASESPEVIKTVVKKVSEIVSEMSGIQLGDRQFAMVESRLKTRLMKLKLHGFKEYLTYLEKHKESESQALLSLMTTHHTYFFREFSHFEFLLNHGLPQAIERARTRRDKTIKVWSAASSRGQEVYSLAMFFKFHLSKMAPDVKFEIWGTDIDPESIHIAQNGVYRVEELKQSPAMYVEGNWIRGSGNVKDFMKVKSDLKNHCHFTTTNLLQPEGFLSDKKFDVIFCRNVFIYFNSDQIKHISQIFLKHLEPQGIIFLGVSETLNGLGLNVNLVGPSVYVEKSKENEKGSSIEKSIKSIPKPRILEVLSVDDSPTILALLKKILNRENGFQVTATAKNGLDALKILKTQKFDIITLDLHMPELDGVGFLKEYKEKSVPVLVVSSINRDDTTIAQQAMKLGASDYVEKPSLENISRAGDEIRGKIKTILSSRDGSSTASKGAKSGAMLNGAKSSFSIPASANAVKEPLAKNSGNQKIKVLIVDDSQTIRNLLNQILTQDPQFEVVALAEKPSQVEGLIRTHKPDVITLDIHMPEMDGVTLLRKIHPLYKIPTVMISSISKEEGPQVLQALEIGAVDYIQKPQMKELLDSAQAIRDRLKIAARANVSGGLRAKKVFSTMGAQIDQESLVVMGASTGGTEALRVVLESLPSQIPPILIVQHIPPVFSAAFAQRLNDLCAFTVKEAVDGEEVTSNKVLIAPGGKQMGVLNRSGKLFIKITDDAPVNRHKPSVDYLFKSVADLKLKHVVGVVLTGMGADGARQLKTLRDQGARTIAQDEATSVVYGMPREAAAMGGAEIIAPLGDVASQILKLCELQNRSSKLKSA